jgi:hypothetical protein
MGWPRAIASHIGTFFANPTAAAWAAAVVAALGFGFTAFQIRIARDTLQAGTIYSIQKDFADLVKRTEDPKFQGCYATPPASNPLDKLAICTEIDAKKTFFDLLVFYRMLSDLSEMSAVTTAYRDRRIRASCIYFNSPRGGNTLNEYKTKALLESSLQELMRNACAKP